MGIPKTYPEDFATIVDHRVERPDVYLLVEATKTLDWTPVSLPSEEVASIDRRISLTIKHADHVEKLLSALDGYIASHDPKLLYYISKCLCKQADLHRQFAIAAATTPGSAKALHFLRSSRVLKNGQSEPRGTPLTAMEITSWQNDCGMVLRAMFHNGQSCDLEVLSSTKISEFVENACLAQGLLYPETYAAEFVHPDSGRVIPAHNDSFVVDIIYSLEKPEEKVSFTRIAPASTKAQLDAFERPAPPPPLPNTNKHSNMWLMHRPPRLTKFWPLRGEHSHNVLPPYEVRIVKRYMLPDQPLHYDRKDVALLFHQIKYDLNNNPAVQHHALPDIAELINKDKKAELINQALHWPLYLAKIFEVGVEGFDLVELHTTCSGVCLVEVLDGYKEEIVSADYGFVRIREVSDHELSLDFDDKNYKISASRGDGRDVAKYIREFEIASRCQFMTGKARMAWTSPDQNGFHLTAGENMAVLDRTFDGKWIYGGNGRGQFGWIPTDHLAPNLSKSKMIKETNAMEELAMVDEKNLERNQYAMMEFAYMHYDGRPDAPENLRILRAKAAMKDADKLSWDLMTEKVRWQSVPMQSALLQMEEEEDKLAVTCFQNILVFMGEIPPPRELILENYGLAVVELGLRNEKMRTEIFCQLAKQTSGNTSRIETSLKRAWDLMLACLTFFTPPRDVEPFFIGYLRSTSAMSQAAEECLLRIERTRATRQRQLAPTFAEMQALTNRSRVPVRIEIADGTFHSYSTDSYTTCKEVLSKLEERYNLPVGRSEFAIILIYGANKTSVPVLPKDRVLDLVSLSARETETSEEELPYKFVFKRVTWIQRSLAPLPDSVIPLVYQELANEFRSGRIFTKVNVLDKARIVVLINLQAVVNPVDAGESFAQFIPPFLRESLKGLRPEPMEVDPNKAMARFIETLSHWELFAHSFFDVDMTHDARFSDGCRVAVSAQSVKFLNPRTKDTVISFEMDDVTGVQCTHTSVSIKAGNLLKKQNIRFQSHEAFVINDLFTAYRKHIQGDGSKFGLSVDDVSWDA